MWPTRSAAVVVMRPVTEWGLEQAVKRFSRIVGRQPRTIALTPRGMVQLLRTTVGVTRYREHLVDGDDVSPITIHFKNTRVPIRLRPSALLPTGWVLLKR